MHCTDYKLITKGKLGDVARVQSGYLSRARVEPSANGTHRLLQARDVSDEGIDLNAAVTFNPERNPDLYRVSRGDILILARGHNHRANLVEIDLHDTLASSVFHIIRPNHEFILSRYLTWWLNQPELQAEIKTGLSGTGIGYVSRQHMEQIPVIVPAHDMQQRIADTMALWRRRYLLQSQLNEKRLLMIQSLCRQAVLQEKKES